MQKILLEIGGMHYSQSQSGAYALVLKEVDGKRRLPIIIGGFEAQAIAIELENMQPARPLTHDLFKSFATAFNILITEVVINKFLQGIFHAQLVCIFEGQEVLIDSRTSDAVALALRFKCPVFALESVMDEASILVDEDKKKGQSGKSKKKEPSGESVFSALSLEELKNMLAKAVEDENYEKASKIRDEINERKEGGE
jgi:uncharacterized protein